MENLNKTYDFLTTEEEKEEDEVLDLSETYELEYINILTAYYNKLVGKKENIFSDIDYDHLNSTNRCMEYIYNHVLKFNECVDEDKKDLVHYKDICNIEEFENFFILSINDVNLYGCELLLPLIMYLSTVDWENLIWDINIMKPTF